MGSFFLRESKSVPPPEVVDNIDSCKSFFAFLACIIVSVFTFFAIVVGVHRSEARFFAKSDTQWGVNYAMLSEAKKILLQHCPDVVSIGDSAGISIDPDVMSQKLGKTFFNLNLYGHTGFSGYLAQVRYLKTASCRPDKIIVYLSPRVILKDHATEGRFENFFTVLQYGSTWDGFAVLLTKIRMFPLVFRISIKTWARYVISAILDSNRFGTVRPFLHRVGEVLGGKQMNGKDIRNQIDELVRAGGAVYFGDAPLDPATCRVAMAQDGNLNDFLKFRQELYNIFNREKIIIAFAAVPDCATDLKPLITKLDGVYDIEPVKIDSSFFVDDNHTNKAGGKLIAERLASFLVGAFRKPD